MRVPGWLSSVGDLAVSLLAAGEATPDPFERQGDAAGLGYTPIVATPSQNQALLNATFYACVSLISGTVARVPLPLYREDPQDPDNRTRERAHPLYRVLERRPNRYQTAFQWKQTRVVYKLLGGNDVCEVATGRHGWELIPLRPDRVILTDTDEDGAPVTYQTWDRAGRMRTLLRDEVLHVPMMTTATGLGGGKIGRSVYDVARDVLALAQARNTFQQRFFVKGATQRGVLEYPETWTKKDSDRLLENLKALNGENGQFGVLLLDKGLTFKPTFVDPRNAQLIESSLLSIADIARLFHMPLPKIGYYKDAATYKSVELLRQDFLDHTIDPHLCADESELNRTLVVEDGLFVEYLRQALMQADSASRWLTYGIGLMHGVLTGNEVRRAENLPKLPGLDEPRVRLDTTPAGKQKRAQAHEGWSGRAIDLQREAARARAAEVDGRRLRGLAEAAARALAAREARFVESVTAATPAADLASFYVAWARRLSSDLALPEDTGQAFAEARANELVDALAGGSFDPAAWAVGLPGELVSLALDEDEEDRDA